MKYSDKLKDPRWQKRRLELFNNAGWRCSECQRQDQSLEVHHCHYVRGLEPWEYPDCLLLVLCSDHHRERQEAEDKLHNAIAVLLRDIPSPCITKTGLRIMSEAMEAIE